VCGRTWGGAQVRGWGRDGGPRAASPIMLREWRRCGGGFQVEWSAVMRRKKLWLCLPLTAMALLDLGLTLRGQPASYWEGSFTDTREGNPVVDAVLRVHPLAVVAAAVVYVLGFTGLILLLPRPVAQTIAVAVAL